MKTITDAAETIREAGVVGAGGAGFPAHVKAAAKVDTIIANGAECEPLIHKDYEVMVRHAAEVVKGVRLLMRATGAPRGIIGIKEKNAAAVEAVTRALDGKDVSLHLLGDFYPSGDEYILVYEATGRLIPPQGIPLDVGVVVNNVETLYNIARAADGAPVTHKWITVAGAVRTPVTFRAPLGMSFQDALAVAGGPAVPEFGVFVGGIMMGSLEFDMTKVVTKTTAGLIALPVSHQLIVRKRQPAKAQHRIGKSACDQCTFCTELCPRYLLGYDVQPHKVMRSLGFTKTGEAFWNQYAALCCACGLCTLYACPESLFPKEACDKGKADMKEHGEKWEGKREVKPHAMYEGRRTPLKQLMKKLGVSAYDHPSAFKESIPAPRRVTLPLAQHIGTPASALVKAGQRVEEGTCVADIPGGKLGARIHASISGIVRTVDTAIVIEQG
ncbi:MAG: 4Fe-4S dicluster domain-containing protein [Bacteroidetes bacterium]|nr:4Fe-4S dicluster domain-containing protein [Bacteroidota bacterium]